MKDAYQMALETDEINVSAGKGYLFLLNQQIVLEKDLERMHLQPGDNMLIMPIIAGG